ncbi:hypothetical protein HZA98_03340 [Candidatus Woesearchaeota archaeon]|nr:hypothetical protein [Candidatus Woesearchaeota archaeon]
MVELRRVEFRVLWRIEEGAESPEGVMSMLDLSLKDIQQVFLSLSSLGLISLNKEQEFWSAQTTEKAKELYAQYEHWIE